MSDIIRNREELFSQSITENNELDNKLVFQSYLLDSVHDAIIAIDENNNISYYNKAFQELFGWTKDEIVGKSISVVLNYVADDSKEKVLDVLIGENAEYICCTNKYKNRLYVDIKTTKLVGPAGEYRGLLSSIRDVTKQKLMQEALRLSEEKYREFVKFAPVAIYEIDFINERILTVNDAMCQLTGYTKEELLSKNLSDMIDDEFKTKYQNRMSKWLRGEKPEENIDYRIIGKDGREIYVELKTKFTVDEEGKPFGANVVSIDVTDRRKMEIELEKREKLYRTIFNSIDEALCIYDVIFDDKGEIIDVLYIDVNPSHEKITGRSNVIGKKISEVLANPDKNLLKLFGKVALTGESIRYKNWDKDTGRFYDGCFSRIDGEEKNRITVLFSDITERIKTEEELLSSEKHALKLVEKLREADTHKNQFIATLSHELRNPMASIMMGLSLIERVQPGSEQALRTREIIIRQIKQLSRLVDDLLDTTRITKNKIKIRKSHIELNKLLEHIILDHQSSFDEKVVKLETNIIPERLYLEADSSRLMQAISNLLHNALKFTPKDGTVLLMLNKDIEKNEALILVSDTGKGIPSKFLPNLFEPFFQAENSMARSCGGLGLGLPITKGIIELHGGRIEASSEGLGKGSQFTIKLPLSESKRNEKEKGLVN